MNVEGAAVERMLGRSIMPRFHAGWQLRHVHRRGTRSRRGRARRTPGRALRRRPRGGGHRRGRLASRRLLPAGEEHEDADATASRSAWLEPRTLAIGFMVLAFTLAEGAANDWLALSLIDGYDARHWVGVLGFALFVASMTARPARRTDRARPLRPGSDDARLGAGGDHGRPDRRLAGVASLAVVGIVLWGLGAALGFPVGMSAAGDDPARAARRVSVVSTIGYGAFLAGPPLLGFVGDHVGTLRLAAGDRDRDGPRRRPGQLGPEAAVGPLSRVVRLRGASSTRSGGRPLVPAQSSAWEGPLVPAPADDPAQGDAVASPGA